MRVWQAREAAKRTRSAGLTLEQARWVDAATTPYLASLPWSRYVALLEAKIIEVDPAAAEECRLAAASERFVETGQCDEHGLKTVIARAAAGDAIWFVAMCDRIARILELDGDTDPVGARRSKALGILADPARAFALLAWHAVDEEVHDEAMDDGSPEPDSEDSPGTGECPTCGDSLARNAAGDPSVLLEAARVDPAELRPRAVLYLHLSQESFQAASEGRSLGVGRMQSVGPVTVEQVREFLTHAQVNVTPVIDLAEDRPVDGYEVPARMREQLQLRSPATAFPFTPSLSTRADADHTTPYLSPDRGGPPGQTGLANLGRLLRLHHRVKTHAPGWMHRQPRPGVHYWRTPHGYWCRVDATGTYSLGRETPAELYDSPLERVLAALVLAA